MAANFTDIKSKIKELAKGPADRSAIEIKLKKLSTENIPKKTIDRDYTISHKQEILDRVQKRAEEYEQVNHSCAKSSALSIMEEFGLGDISNIRALSAFPGIALTGETCGGVNGALVALSLYFGSDDQLDHEATARCLSQGRKLVSRFQEAVGTTKCYNIHKDLVFGQYYDTMDPTKGFANFMRDKGFEKCALLPGIGARLGAEIIIEDMEKKKAKGG
jgi:C_GCAxxG_C_C family probable redox protein